MALTEETVQDKLEIVGEFKHIQVRTATIIKRDDVEISRTFHRHVVAPGDDASTESDDVKALVTQFHTDAVVTAYNAHLAANTPS